MSRKLLAFLLSELKTVRIICAKCGGTAEMTVKQLGARSGLSCPACRNELIEDAYGPTKHPLFALGKAIEHLQDGAPQPFKIEFVLPDESESEAKK